MKTKLYEWATIVIILGVCTVAVWVNFSSPLFIEPEPFYDYVGPTVETRKLERQVKRDQEAFLDKMDTDFQCMLDRLTQATPEQRAADIAVVLAGFIEMEDIMDGAPESLGTIQLQLKIDLMRIRLRHFRRTE